ncbi:SWI/SNF chromatin-remodeling complex subunit [Lachnellula subtilissima]|uniref:SWI/SNF chromatin-remodeling complex subunit n=1 Tax=Lachnellula subtilissima TaxID=602034 RepID=A0A8H8UBS2_9HELO|nr:SWI/SNF chromatin-remodeling complex subunit [Lachnellula subtilissima]
MSSWMNDAAVQNHNGAGFNHLDSNPGGAMLDPSNFMNNPTSFDPAHFQNQQLQQRMQNGAMRNGSPSFNNPVYQTNPVIPSKRPRPREDSLGGSPRQAPNMLPNSRSQTPQQNQYSGFPANNAPQQQHATQQAPYSHLQNGSSNASPSPIMGNQLRPGGVPQRVSTASPHPFSPAAQQFSQASPSQSDHGSRVDTPQSSNPYTQNPGFAQGFNQNFTPPPGRTSAPPQNAMSTPQPHMQQSQLYAQQQAQQHAQQQARQQQQGTPQSMDQQKLLYQMRMQQQMQQQNLMAGQRANMPLNVNPMAKQMPGQNGQFTGIRAQQQAAQSRGNLNPENFLKSLQSFMQQRSLPLDMNPAVGDKSVALMTLYMTVMRYGGYKKVSAQNGWNQVAQALHFPPIQSPTAAAQLKGHYERNLLMFEEAWQLNQQRQRAAMMQHTPNAGGQVSPTKQINPQVAMQQSQQFMQQQALMGQQHHLQQQQMQSTPVKQMHSQQQPVNGFSTPQQPPGQPHIMGSQGHARNSLSRTIEATTPQNGSSFTMPSPVSASKPGSLSLQSPQVASSARADEPVHTEYNLPDVLDPKVRSLDTFGGVQVESLLRVGSELTRSKPDIPAALELGLIDIDALTRSLQCGIHAEVRLALDTLCILAVDSRLQFDLTVCEDLVETLIDCAEDQVELLAENAAEVSDVMLISSYEDVVRSNRSDQENLQDVPKFGSLESELNLAVNKLICITTIMRNLSFHDKNHALLADELVVKFLCVVVRYLGTRNMLLRTNINTLDFMKDLIVILSNLAQAIELPGREQALCLLHFLLAFAPCPPPNTVGADSVVFTPYDPAIHRYLPAAVDSLAKLLARDEPNRTFYKTIFASDATSSAPFDLLTKTFALAISPLPDDKQGTKRGHPLVPVAEARKPVLMQGILAAEILANLAPGFETGLANSWLRSEDGFAQKLSRLILTLCLETAPQVPQQRGQNAPKGVEDADLFHITQGGIAVLRRLAEKSRNPEDPRSTTPFAGLPSKESLLAALKIVNPRLQGILKQLCAYAGRIDTWQRLE